MFERFTRDARDSVTRAQDIARSTGAGRIGAEHVLLGAAAQPGSVAARSLDRLGIAPASLAESVRALGPDVLDAEALARGGVDLESVRTQVEATFGPGALDAAAASPTGRLALDPTAKKLLELALREAIRFTTNRIDTGHLLLAAARLDGTSAAKALAWFGHDRAAVEQAVVATWADGERE